MTSRLTRREWIAGGVSALGALGVPKHLWALQSDEELVDFADYTPEFKIEAQPSNPRVRCFDLRRLTSWATPNEEFYTFNQTEVMRVDATKWRLRIDGFVDHPKEFTLDDLKKRSDKREEAVTLECSGNATRPTRMSGLLSNAVWSGVGLASILKECGVKSEAREVVFIGLDQEKEKKFQAGNEEYSAGHARSMYVQDALSPEAMLAYEMNGKTLPAEQGFPVRLILPGWYGMTQVKWLTRIYVLDRRYEGRHMDRNYLSLRSVDGPDGPVWFDTSISKNNLKSVVARVTRRRSANGFEYKISGVAWGGQVPIEKVEVKIDDGAWRPATVTDQHGKYAWTLWSTNWTNPTAGKHTLVSRAIDANGVIQPTADEWKTRIASGRENNSQWPRPIVIN
jgi:DMSO/TMAO reductase YedYZ molybdopterin-dependent catalytic subunit